MILTHDRWFIVCVVFVRQVPLVIFKREKEVARKLEFDGLYITEQPSEDDIKGQWDRLVINTQWVTPSCYYHKKTNYELMKDDNNSNVQPHIIVNNTSDDLQHIQQYKHL